MAEETWPPGGEEVAGCNRSSGSIKTAAEPTVSTPRNGAAGAILTFAMPDSGPMNSECWC